MNNKNLNNFINNGYCIINLFDKKEFKHLCRKIEKKINNQLSKNKKIQFSKLYNYHKKGLEDDHGNVINSETRFILLDKKLINPIYSNKTIKKISQFFWGHSKYDIKWVGSLKNPMKKNATGFRIARPIKFSTKDVGGEHIDLHYGGAKNKNQKKLFTIWCPIIGFSNSYTLRLAPKSHKMDHPFNKLSNQKKYITKVFKKTYVKKFNFVRPNLKPGQGIFFHPNLIHGSSLNYGTKTRISIDLRIFNNDI